MGKIGPTALSISAASHGADLPGAGPGSLCAKPPVETIIRTISLPGCSRRGIFGAPPESLGLDWEYLDASSTLLDGLDYDPALSRRHCKRSLHKAEIGCYSSHVQAWRMLLAHPHAVQMIVLEDDVAADWQMLAKIASYDWSALNVHYLKLSARAYPSARTLTRSHPQFHAARSPFFPHHLLQFTGLALGTQAYLITRQAAARFSAHCQVISRPIDREIDRAWATGIPVIGFVPFPAMELSLPSIIGYHGLERTDLSPLQMIGYYAARAVERARIILYRYFSVSPRIPKLL